MKAKTVRRHATGGPEVLKLEVLDLPEPGQGEVSIRYGEATKIQVQVKESLWKK